MRERLTVLLAQARAFWATLTPAKKVLFVTILAGVLAGVLVTAQLGSRENYTYLFTDLSSEDSAAISAKLKELKVPYRVAASGTALEVPEERVHEIRLDLAGQGLPRGGGVGFELFDKHHLGATELEQRVSVKRALEGELARTISTIGAVQSARVHLVMPEKSLFAAHAREPASASVVLKLRPGRAFAKPEVQSIVHLVASAVPGLGENAVSIVGADGITLHRPRPDGAGAASEILAEREREVAAQLEEQARGQLERTLGPGHADVRVAVELDPATREHTEEKYDPQKTVLRSEQKTEERAAGITPTVAGVPQTSPSVATGAGVPGAQSNLPGGTSGPENAGGAAGPARTSWTRNWEMDRTIDKVVLPSGKVARMSVAVMIDANYKDGVALPRDRAELDRLGELVKGAVGFSGARGDSLRVESAPFASSATPEPPAKPTEVSKLRQARWYGPIAGAAALLAFLGFLWTRRRRAARRRAAMEALPPVPVAGEIEAPREAFTTDEDRARLKQEVIDLVQKDPASAALVLRGWLNEDDGEAALPRAA